MQKISNRIYLLFVLMSFVFGIFGLTSCSEGNKTSLKLSFEQNEYELEVGEELELVPTIKNAGEEPLTFVWKSYNEDVASVLNGTVTGNLIGKTQVKVSVLGQTSVSATVTIKVVSASQEPTVEFKPVKKILNLNDTFQIEYTILDSENTYTFVYESLNEEVLTVDATGLIRTHSEGTAVVVVKFYDSTTGKFVSYNFSIDVYENYPINYVLDGGTNSENNPDGYTVSQKPFALEPATKEGYKFAGWYDNADLEGTAIEKINTALETEITLYAKWIELTYVVAETFDPSKEYVFGMVQENLNQKLFMTGKIANSYYGETVNDPYDAGKVTFVEVDGGYNIKITLKDGSVKYVNVVVDGTYINIEFSDTLSTIWQYNEEYNTFTTVLNGTTYFLGTSGDKTYNTFSASNIKYASSNFVGHLYEEVEYTDELRVEDALFEVSLPETLARDYTLPENENIQWSLKEESEFATVEDGVIKLNRPSYGSADEEIVVVAKCNINDASACKEFVVRVLAYSSVEEVFGFDTNKKYKLGLYQEKLNEQLWLTGEISGRYASTNSNPIFAADVQVIATASGYQLLVNDKYLEFANNSQSKISVVLLDSPTADWTYDSDHNTFLFNYSGTTYFLGTYDTYNTISASDSYYIDKGNFIAHLYEVTITESEINAWLNNITVSSSMKEEYELPETKNVVWSLKEEHDDVALNNCVLTATQKDTEYTITVVATYDGTEYTKEFEITVEALNQSGESSEPELLATFEFGADGEASHKDGSDLGSSKTYTEGGYSLALTSMSKVYGSARDAKGNSCIKLGTSSEVGTFTFEVSDEVTKVVIYVAKYKDKTTKVDINGTQPTINTLSDNGEYTSIEIDTSSTKTITFTTVSGGYRCMINSVEYWGAVSESDEPETNEPVVEQESKSIIATEGTLSETVITWTATNFLFENAKASSSTNIRTSDTDHFRCYAGSKTTITGINSKITQVVITCTESKYVTALVNSITDTTSYKVTVSGLIVTIESNIGAVDSIEITNSAQTRVKNIEVSYVKQ